MPPTKDKSGPAALIAAATAVVMLVASLGFILLQLRTPADRFAACAGVRLPAGQEMGGPFKLTDHTGARVTDGDVIDRPALLYFGYTFCPDVCPLDVVRNADAVDILAEDGYEVRPVFITVDPARDTAEALSDYAEAMHPEMVALTGSEAEITETLAKFRAFASKQDGDPEYYVVSHTTLTYLMLPGEGVVAFFTRSLSAEEIAETTTCYLDAA